MVFSPSGLNPEGVCVQARGEKKVLIDSGLSREIRNFFFVSMSVASMALTPLNPWRIIVASLENRTG